MECFVLCLLLEILRFSTEHYAQESNKFNSKNQTNIALESMVEWTLNKYNNSNNLEEFVFLAKTTSISWRR